ncbi:hypothetical protein [Acidisphaera sp. S103]|uniref:hypothetical protein n=1 Tax=Acidisphaera sp. S103 TaxID=1747223 RepID=UPI00131DABC3|nr:hypothetical protein [Acidisphaera sp. S103]
MGGAIVSTRTLYAALCEVERGVYYASYPESDPNTDKLTSYQTGRSAADAKRRIELNARALGYDIVIWQQTIAAPLFARHGKPAGRQSATP